MLRAQGVSINGPYFDTMLAHALCDPEQRHSMDYLAELLLGYTPMTLADVVASIEESQETSAAVDNFADDLFALAEQKEPKSKALEKRR